MRYFTLNNPRIKIYFLFLVLIVGVWSPSFQAPYLFDDYRTPVNDLASQSIAGWVENLTTTLRPLTKLTFAIESELGFTAAPKRRLFNYFVLILNSILVFELALLLGMNLIFSIFSAAIFAIHPLQADLFILLGGRSALIEQFFLLVGCYFIFNRTESQSKHWIPVFVLAMAAILSRETAILAAAFLVIIARPRFSKLIRFLLVLALLALPFLNPVFQGLMIYSKDYVATASHLGLQFAGLSRGLVWTVLPLNLTIDHDFVIVGFEKLFWIFISVLICAASFFYFFKTKSKASIIGLCGLLILLPTQSLVGKLDPLTERPFATALPFFLLVLIYNVSIFAKNKLSKAAVGILIIVFMSFSFLTWQRAFLFQDEISIWTEAVHNSKWATRPLVNLATLLVQKKRYDEAILYLNLARDRNPVDFDIQQKLKAAQVLKNQ